MTPKQLEAIRARAAALDMMHYDKEKRTPLNEAANDRNALLTEIERLRKPHKRTVHVLESVVHYESSTVLGVYSTKRRAEKAQQEHVAKGFQPDEYSITPYVVDV